MVILLLLFCVTPSWGLQATYSASTSGINFGIYDNTSALPTNTSGTVSVSCQAPIAGLLVSYSVSFSAGNGTISQRKLNNASSQLNYNLYRDSGYSVILGNTSGQLITGGMLLTLLNIPVTNNHTYYAQLQPSQPAIPGTYSDTITMTVTF